MFKDKVNYLDSSVSCEIDDDHNKEFQNKDDEVYYNQLEKEFKLINENCIQVFYETNKKK